MKKADLIGEKFGKLVVVEYVGMNKHKKSNWKCICECGETCICTTGNLKSGNSAKCKKCKNKSQIKHKVSNNRILTIWSGMKRRCYVEHDEAYPKYGGRGIKICDEWLNNVEMFEKWALENGYDDSLSIDRIDVNGDYCPENCRWADDLTQQNNRSNNHLLTFYGETKTIREWERVSGISRSTFMGRIKKGETDPDKIFAKYIKAKKKEKYPLKHSGVKGVTFIRHSGKWRVIHNKKHMGCFKNLEDAIKLKTKLNSELN